MNTAVDFFSAAVPAHVTNSKSKAMQAMAGGLTGGGFGNRLSLFGNRLRFIQGGVEVGVVPENYLDVVVFAMASQVQRIYYSGPWDPNSKEPPTCFSLDGKAPSDESQEKQSPVCATCPQNVKGSGRMPNTKACAYKKRVVILSPEDLEGPMFALDVNAMSMFGDQIESSHLYSFKGYYEKLVAHNMDIAAIVTRLTFDSASSVPKLHFSPKRALTTEEFAAVQARMEDEEVEKMLADMTNDVEVVAPAAAQQAPARVVSPAVRPAAPTVPVAAASQGVGGLVQDVAPAVKRGFPSKGGASAKPNGGAPTPAATATPPVELDLTKLVNFD
jgi:hypothetical protein